MTNSNGKFREKSLVPEEFNGLIKIPSFVTSLAEIRKSCEICLEHLRVTC